MPPFDSLALLTGGAVTGIAMIAWAATLSFRRWIELRRYELGAGLEPAPAMGAASRIEIADLKERVRKLEAIAAGVDL